MYVILAIAVAAVFCRLSFTAPQSTVLVLKVGRIVRIFTDLTREGGYSESVT